MPVFNGIKLSQEQVDVLEDAVVKRKNRKIKLVRDGVRFYHGKHSAKNGLRSLEGKGILERRDNGIWVITNLPDELHSKWVKS